MLGCYLYNAFCCCFSYHALLELQYSDKWHKSLAAKGLVKSEGLSVRKAECHLGADLFLDKYPWWKAGGPHHLFILQRMFLHTTESGWKEMEQMIHQGCWQEPPRLDARVDVSIIQLVGYKTSWEEIQELYIEVYMLRRLPGPPPCGPEWVQELAQDILSLCGRVPPPKGGATMPDGDQEHGPTRAPAPHY